MRTHALQRRINLSKRKTSALRTPDTRFSHTKRQSEQTFYTHESKTIDLFDGVKPLSKNCLWTLPSTIAPTPAVEKAEHCET